MTIIQRWPVCDGLDAKHIGIAVDLEEWPNGVPNALISKIERIIEATWIETDEQNGTPITDGTETSALS